MALDQPTKSKLLSVLTAYIAEQSQASMTASQLDAGYASLTAEEKQTILRSILDGGESAKNIIMVKLQGPIREAAQLQAQAYIDTNSIPLDVISGLILRGK